MSETLKEWAARVAPSMDANMWRTCEAHAERSAPSLGRMEPQKARALLVHRDKVRQQRYQASKLEQPITGNGYLRR